MKTSQANENVEMSSKLSYLQKYLSSGESIKTADGGEIKKKKKKKDKKARGAGFKVRNLTQKFLLLYCLLLAFWGASLICYQ